MERQFIDRAVAADRAAAIERADARRAAGGQ
jgi:hypothetical protein